MNEKPKIDMTTIHIKITIRNILDTWGIYINYSKYIYATLYYRQTKDIETLRCILGHSDISTITIYITLANIDVENGMKSFKSFL